MTGLHSNTLSGKENRKRTHRLQIEINSALGFMPCTPKIRPKEIRAEVTDWRATRGGHANPRRKALREANCPAPWFWASTSSTVCLDCRFKP